MKRKLSLNKGITIISLIVTIVIMIILTAVIITDKDTGSNYKKYKLMCADVELLEDKVLLYYSKYAEIPTTGEEITEDIPTEIFITNTGSKFYKLNVNKLSNITLNYGEEEDVFIIDTITFEVFYLNGIEYEDKVYYNKEVFSVNE